MANLHAHIDGTPRSAVFRKGDVLDGKYRVERELAVGGIGVVHLAHHLQLDRPVAIKHLQADALQHRELVAQFEREARIVAKMKSENVVRVHDVGVHPSIGPYMVMELLEGKDLDELLQAGPLPIQDAVAYVLQACNALSEAHGLDIVHRDLKPSNLFLANRPPAAPVVKLIDFGISRVVPKQGANGVWAAAREANAGTPHYMSPEQLRSGHADVRSDVWALGVVLHELVSGTLPFDAPTIDEMCHKILAAAPVPLSAVRPDVPPALEGIVLACLEKDPSRRLQSVDELVRSLAPFVAPVAASASAAVAAPSPSARRGPVDPRRRAATVVVRQRETGLNRNVIGAAVGLMIAMAIGGLLLARSALNARGGTPSAASAASASPDTPSSATSATAVATATTETPTKIDPAPSASAATSVAASSAPAPAKPRPRTRTGTGTGASDPRSQFGERH